MPKWIRITKAFAEFRLINEKRCAITHGTPFFIMFGLFILFLRKEITSVKLYDTIVGGLRTHDSNG